jgi:thiamine biosynthesis lipoprotein
VGGAIASEVTDRFRHAFTALGTVVTIEVVGHGATDDERRERYAAVERAAGWFDEVERRCSRFDPESELSRLGSRVGEPITVSPLLFQAVRFAIELSQTTNGAFDPCLGARLAQLGFDRHHRTGTPVATPPAEGSVQDIELDEHSRTIRLHRAIVLDLGAVAKGLAIDLASREVSTFGNYAVIAGGDGYFAGFSADGDPWTVGVRDPRRDDALVDTLSLSNSAVCTSGDYERRGADGSHHLLDPRTGASASGCSSVTVVAPTAIVADGLSTAAFVLGPDAGLRLLTEQGGVDGMIITDDGRVETPDFAAHRSAARPVRS